MQTVCKLFPLFTLSLCTLGTHELCVPREEKRDTQEADSCVWSGSHGAHDSFYRILKQLCVAAPCVYVSMWICAAFRFRVPGKKGLRKRKNRKRCCKQNRKEDTIDFLLLFFLIILLLIIAFLTLSFKITTSLLIFYDL